MTDLLGLYYMDALDQGQSDLIERHLAACPECRGQADETVQTIAALELISGDERDDLLDSFGALDRTGPPPERFVRFFAEETPPAMKPSQAAALRPDNGKVVKVIAADPPGEGPVDPPPPKKPTSDLPKETAPPSREAFVRPGGRRFGWRNRRTAALVQAGALLTVVLLVGGLALGALLGSPGDTSVPTVTAAATAEDISTGASVSVVATQQENGAVGIRATVNGLKAGSGYRLHAVTTDDLAVPVVNWTADGKLQDINGEIQVPIGMLSSFTVSLAGEGPVVSAYLTPSEAPSAAPTE